MDKIHFFQFFLYDPPSHTPYETIGKEKQCLIKCFRVLGFARWNVRLTVHQYLYIRMASLCLSNGCCDCCRTKRLCHLDQVGQWGSHLISTSRYIGECDKPPMSQFQIWTTVGAQCAPTSLGHAKLMAIRHWSPRRLERIVQKGWGREWTLDMLK